MTTFHLSRRNDPGNRVIIGVGFVPGADGSESRPRAGSGNRPINTAAFASNRCMAATESEVTDGQG